MATNYSQTGGTGTTETPNSLITAPWGDNPAALKGAGASIPAADNGVEQYSNGTAGAGLQPNLSMYSDYMGNAGVAKRGDTLSMDADALRKSLAMNVWDPAGSGSRGRYYGQGFFDPTNVNVNGAANYHGGDPASGNYKYNQMLMTVAQSFDPFMQYGEREHPHWWLNRIPRGAFQLHNGIVQETRIYRGGLSHYAGLGSWSPLNGDPTSPAACKPRDYTTYQYAWESLAWSGKSTAWGSDPICVDILKFVSKAAEQIKWILETGVKFGTAIQNVWNRDNYINHTVMAGRSYVMTSAYRGATSPRFVYNPFVALWAKNPGGVEQIGTPNVSGGDLVAKTSAVTGSDGKPHPFVVFNADEDVEPLNFDVLGLVRNQLKRRCPQTSLGSIGGDKLFALCVSEEDVENYIRGNEEERRYWIEANPQALINHYGFAPTTFRKWVITCDDDQLRFKLHKFIAKGSSASVLEDFGNVGLAEFTDGSTVQHDLWVAIVVDPEIAGRAGINGSAVPVPNPEYDTAELAIAPVFMNKVFTNLFVPDEHTIPGTGTWFGPKTGLNGKWAWRNIPGPQNPDNRVGNFYGEFDIVPKPDMCVYDCISFLYRRCTEPLRSFCPAENVKINPAAASTNTSAAVKSVVKGGADSPASAADPIVKVVLATDLVTPVGTKVKIFGAGSAWDDSDSDSPVDYEEESASEGASSLIGYVVRSEGRTKEIQLMLEAGGHGYVGAGSVVTVLAD